MFEGLKVIYAEDEDFIRENIVETLEFMSINVTAVSNGEEAYKKYLEEKPDIIIADIEMPKLNGLQLIQKIREKDKTTQIIITTAYKDEPYLLKAVELNLVKYLLKPIHISELKNALILCANNLKGCCSRKYFNEKSYYDEREQKLIIENSEVKLDFNETKFLKLLLRFPNSIVPYDQIEVAIWGEYGLNIESLRTLVKKLRQKLPKDTILNISKTGYKVALAS